MSVKISGAGWKSPLAVKPATLKGNFQVEPLKLRCQQSKSGWKKILKVMFKKFYTQLCAAALLCCVAITDIQAAPSISKDNNNKPSSSALKDGNLLAEPERQLPDTSFLIKEVVVSSGMKKRNVSMR